MSDLSEYERVRLENIQRNLDFLASIGLESVKPLTVNASNRSKKKRKTTSARNTKQIIGTRSSKRIKQQEGEVELSSEEEGKQDMQDEDLPIDYAEMPMGPEDLDDFEFQLFVALRKWRLDKARSLEIETYKIFPNRVLVECIRRRRNDPDWAIKDNRDELIDCWGIGE